MEKVYSVQSKVKYSRKKFFQTAFSTSCYMLGRRLDQYVIRKNNKIFDLNSVSGEVGELQTLLEKF